MAIKILGGSLGMTLTLINIYKNFKILNYNTRNTPVNENPMVDMLMTRLIWLNILFINK